MSKVLIDRLEINFEAIDLFSCINQQKISVLVIGGMGDR